jgi:RNA polymerase sigma factor (sigma-70 family)
MAGGQLRHVLWHIRSLVGAAPAGDASDRTLLARFADARDQDAFAELVRRHGPLVWGVCRRRLCHEQDAEDAFQATFLVLARKAGAHGWQPSIAGWLYETARRTAQKAHVAAARRRAREQEAQTMWSVQADAEQNPDELREAVSIELARLPSGYREPLLLCALEGLTTEEAARRLGCPAGTVKSRLARGRHKLRAMLLRRGVTLSAAGLAGLLAQEATAVPPRLLVESTITAALTAATGQLGTSAAAILAQEASKTMPAFPLKIAIGVLLAAGVALGYRLVIPTSPPESDAPPTPAQQTSDAKTPKTDLFGDPLPDDAIARLGTNRFWCGGTGIEVAFTSDSSKILAANWVTSLVIDAATGREVHRLLPDSDYGVESMAVSPDGKLVALGTFSRKNPDTEPNCIRIFDLANGQILRQCKHAGRQQYLGTRFSPDGKLLASYSYPSKSVDLWDPLTGQNLRRWPTTSEVTSCLAFSSDSKVLIVGDGRTIHFWNAATGVEVRRIDDHPGIASALAVSPDGKMLATQGLKNEPKVGEGWQRANAVHLWDAATCKKLRQIEPVVEAGRKKRGRPTDPPEVVAFCFSPDGKSLLTAGGDHILRVWDVATGKKSRRWDSGEWTNAIACSPDGKTLASLGGGHIVRLWEVSTGKELRENPGHLQGFQFLALSPDGRTLASGGWDKDVRLWDTATGKLLRRVAVGEDNVRPLRFSTDGRALTTLAPDQNVQVWDVATGKKEGEFSAPIPSAQGYSRQHAISADGKTGASSYHAQQGKCDEIILWDANSGKKLHVLAGDQGWIGALGFSHDGRTLYSWGWEKKVRIWDVAGGKLVREFAAGVPQVYSGSFSSDGKWFACSSREHGVLLYDMASGSEMGRVRVSGIYDNLGIAFSPDGRTMAASDEDGTIHLLELASRKVRHRLAGGHRAGAGVLIFSADSERLVSGSGDTSAIVWDLTGRTTAKLQPLAPADLDTSWTDLRSDDAVQAYQAIRRLAASLDNAVPHLAKRLQPAASADAKHVARLIADLDSDQFAARDQAAKVLEELGESAIGACRKALEGDPSPELRRRLEKLLEKQARQMWSPSSEQLRNLRSLEVLELAGTPEARQVLQKLANGAPEARLTREAKAGLERLERRQYLR